MIYSKKMYFVYVFKRCYKTLKYVLSKGCIQDYKFLKMTTEFRIKIEKWENGNLHLVCHFSNHQ